MMDWYYCLTTCGGSHYLFRNQGEIPGKFSENISILDSYPDNILIQTKTCPQFLSMERYMFISW